MWQNFNRLRFYVTRLTLSERIRWGLRNFVVVLLIVYLFTCIGKLTSRLVYTPAQIPALSGLGLITKPSKSDIPLTIAKIQQLHIFGEFKKAVVPLAVQVTSVPKTNLKLTLTGVVASSEENAGAAIVENKGQQKMYGIGDKIDGTRATIVHVLADRIIIRNVEKEQTLMLDGIDYQ